MFNKGSVCFSSFVGRGSKRHVEDLDEEIRKVSSGRSTTVKECCLTLTLTLTLGVIDVDKCSISPSLLSFRHISRALG